MANTKKTLTSGPGHAGVLELGASGETVRVASGARFKNTNTGAITASSTDSQAGGTLLAYDRNLVTSGNDAHAVTLPVPTVGEDILVHVTTGAYAVKVYPHSGGNINGGTTDAAVVCKEALPQRFVALSSTYWSWHGTVNS